MDRVEYLYQRKNRCVGRILGELEGIVPDELMAQVRRTIKTRVSEYHSDVLSVIDDNNNVILNDLAVRVRDRVGG